MSSSGSFEPALSTYQHEFWDDEDSGVHGGPWEEERSKKSVSFWVALGLVAMVALICGGVLMTTHFGGGVSSKNAMVSAKQTVSNVNVGSALSPPLCPNGEYLAAQTCHKCTAGYFCKSNTKKICPAGSFQGSMGKAVCGQSSCGKYVPAPGATTEETCRAGTYSPAGAVRCTATPVGTFTGAGACGPNKCPKGSYQDCNGQSNCQKPPCGHYVDTVGSKNFKPCAAGTYQPLSGQTGCKDTAPGEYSGPGHCKPRKCIPGYFQPLVAQGSCKPADCGKYVSGAGSNNQVACGVGTYQPQAGEPSCLPIPAGYISDQGGCAIKCCSAGKFRNAKFVCQDAPCGFYVPNKCASKPVKCAPGEYTNGPGASTCIAAPPGYTPTASQCGKKPCDKGTYQPLSGQTTCKDAKCGEKAPSTGMANPMKCPAGSFQDKLKQTSCKPCAKGSATALTGQCSCPECVAGTYQPNMGKTKCIDSPCGKFVAGKGATQPMACPPGQYQPKKKQTGCLPAAPGEYAVGGTCQPETCPAGTFTDGPSRTKCTDSPCGYSVPSAGASAVTPCPAGQYQPLAGQTKCLPTPTGSYTSGSGKCAETLCKPGFYQDQPGQKQCNPAQCGHYVVIQGSASQNPCGAGRYQPKIEQTSCLTASKGHFVAGQTACQQDRCPTGSYTDCNGQAECIKAPCGYIVTGTGGQAVSACPAGTYQDMVGQSVCKGTPAGSFSKSGYCKAQQCDPGSFQPLARQSSCKLASCGNFVAGEGRKTQTQCPAKSYQPKTGQVGCIPTALAPNPGTCNVGSNPYFSNCPTATQGTFGSGWQLVRRVGPSHGRWHPATDRLAGTAVYGTFVNSATVDATFSKKFSSTPFTQFLFMTGDCSTWVLASKTAVIGATYSNALRRTCRTSMSPNSPTNVRWYNRAGVIEDPWISTIDHGKAFNTGQLVYGEANFGNVHASTVIPVKNGANVFIRNVKLDADGCAAGGAPPVVCPSKPASSQLVGLWWKYKSTPIGDQCAGLKNVPCHGITAQVKAGCIAKSQVATTMPLYFAYSSRIKDSCSGPAPNTCHGVPLSLQTVFGYAWPSKGNADMIQMYRGYSSRVTDACLGNKNSPCHDPGVMQPIAAWMYDPTCCGD